MATRNQEIADRFSQQIARDVEALPAVRTKAALAASLQNLVVQGMGRRKNLLSGTNIPADPREWNEFVQVVHDHLATCYRDAGSTIDWEASAHFFPEASGPARRVIERPESRLAVRHDLTIVTKQTYRSATLDDWQDSFAVLFDDAESDLPMTELLRHLVVDSTKLTEAVRKERYDEALSWFPKMFSWVCSIGTRGAQFDDLSPDAERLSAVVWHKFPNVCSLCAEARCICATLDADAMNKKERDEMRVPKLSRARARLEDMPGPLDAWVEMFDRIYGVPHSTTSAAMKIMHYWEEVGELENELWHADRRRHEGKQAPSEWEDELADVFSWLVSTFLHIRRYVTRSEQLMNAFDSNVRRIGRGTPLSLGMPTFAELVWLGYEGKRRLACVVCDAPVCTCCDAITFPRR